MIASQSIKNMMWRRGFIQSLGGQSLSPVETKTVTIMILGGTPPANLATAKANWSMYNATTPNLLGFVQVTLSEVQLGKYMVATDWARTGINAMNNGIASWAVCFGDYGDASAAWSAATIPDTVALAMISVSDITGTAPLRLLTTTLQSGEPFFITDMGFMNV
jgi:hypothetical protein